MNTAGVLRGLFDSDTISVTQPGCHGGRVQTRSLFPSTPTLCGGEIVLRVGQQRTAELGVDREESLALAAASGTRV